MVVVLRLPHLVLADVGHDDRMPFGRAPDVVDHVRRIQVPVVGQILDVADRGITLQLVDVAQPGGALAVGDAGQQVLEHVAQVADDADVDLDVLADLGRVDVDVDLAGVRRVGLEVAGDAIVEAHAERQQQVGFLNRGVDPGLAVHAHHAEIEPVRGRHAADAEQGHRDRNLGPLRELPDDRRGVRQDDAVAGEDHRPLRPC